MADDAATAGEPGTAGPAQRGFGLLVPPRSQASGVSALPGDYRSLLEAVAAVAAQAGGPVTCAQAARRAGLDVAGRQAGNARARLRRLEDRGWLRRTATGKFTIAPWPAHGFGDTPLACQCALPLSRQTLTFVAGLLRAHPQAKASIHDFAASLVDS